MYINTVYRKYILDYVIVYYFKHRTCFFKVLKSAYRLGKHFFRRNCIFQDVLSVAFSVDSRQIVSGSRDRTIKLWNTLAECKYTIPVSYLSFPTCFNISYIISRLLIINSYNHILPCYFIEGCVNEMIGSDRTTLMF